LALFPDLPLHNRLALVVPDEVISLMWKGQKGVFCCNVEMTEGRIPNWTTISADGGPVGKTPFWPFHITTVMNDDYDRFPRVRRETVNTTTPIP